MPTELTVPRPRVYAALDSEREYQQSRWNPETTESNGNHSFSEWIAYMEDYLAEAKHILAREAKQTADPKVTHIMRKVTAMGVAAMEQLGAPYRDGFEPKVYKNPNCTINHPGSPCNIECGS